MSLHKSYIITCDSLYSDCNYDAQYFDNKPDAVKEAKLGGKLYSDGKFICKKCLNKDPADL